MNTEALRGLAGFLAAEGIAAATDEKNYGMAGNHYENAKAMARRRSIDGHLKFVQSLLTTPAAMLAAALSQEKSINTLINEEAAEDAESIDHIPERCGVTFKKD